MARLGLYRCGAISSVCILVCAPALHAQHTFVRGDANDDGRIDIADPVSTLLQLFGGSAMCADSSDVNDDGAIDLSDAVHALQFLFLAGPAPGAPFPDCGGDPTLDGLDCEQSRSCPAVENEIVDLRRVNGGIEIELRSDMPFPVRALPAVLCTGEVEIFISRPGDGGDLHTIIFLLTEEESARLHDGDLVTVQHGGCYEDLSFLRPFWDLWIFGPLDLSGLEG